MSGEERRSGAPQGPPWSLDLLSDLHAGVLDEETADELRDLVRDDPEANEVLAALDAASTDLADLPDLTMPNDVAARLDAALADEVQAWASRADPTASLAASVPVSAPAEAAPQGTGDAEVVDLASARQRRRRRFGLGAGLLAAAAAVTGVVVFSALPDDTAVQAGDPPGGPQLSGPPPLALQSDQLAPHQFQEVLKSDQLGALADPQRLISCLQANGIRSGNPMGSRAVTLNGRPGEMLVLSTGKIGEFRLLTVGPDCGPDNPATISDSTFGG